jgi:hypothetical protein
MLTVAHSYASGKRHEPLDRRAHVREYRSSTGRPGRESMNAGIGIGIFYAIMFVLVLIYLAESH